MLHCAPIMHCTLLVPDVLPPGLRDAPQVRSRTPRLAALLARGNTATLPANSMESWLCDAFGVSRQNDWPVAPLTLSADGGDPSSGFWLRCDPVHLLMRRNRMHVSDAAGVPSDAESIALVKSLNTHFQSDGLNFHAGAAGRWYLRTQTHTALSTHTLFESIDREIDGYMPSGPDSGYWRRIVNEVQMLLHAHPVNAEREARGVPAINSIWLWGGGVAPRVKPAPGNRIWADDPLARALAAQSAMPLAPLPPGAEAVLAADGDALVVVTAVRDASRDIAAWLEAVERIEQDWFAPFHSALEKRRIVLLTLVITGARQSRHIDITAANLWRWWRRSPAPGAYA